MVNIFLNIQFHELCVLDTHTRIWPPRVSDIYQLWWNHFGKTKIFNDCLLPILMLCCHSLNDTDSILLNCFKDMHIGTFTFRHNIHKHIIMLQNELSYCTMTAFRRFRHQFSHARCEAGMESVTITTVVDDVRLDCLVTNRVVSFEHVVE